MYAIVRNRHGQIEQVHKKRLRKSDYVIHWLPKEEWNDFMIFSKINPLSSKSVDDYLSNYYIFKSKRNYEVLQRESTSNLLEREVRELCQKR